jgi:hypothetical protein
MAAKSLNSDPNNPDLSVFKNLSDDQITSMLMNRAGTPLSQKQAQSQVDYYRQNPSALASMNIGGTYTPSGPGSYGAAGYGQAGISGGITTGGMSGLDFANLVKGFAPQQQAPQQQPQQPQMPQLAPAQPMPRVQTTPLTPTAQMPVTPPPTMNVPQASAAAATPLFSLGQMPQMTQPQLPQPQNPLIQRFQTGGEVQPQPTDPFTGQPLSTQDQAYANLGLYHAYAPGTAGGTAIDQMGSPTQLGAQYQPTLLGAAALQSAPVINLPPSGQPSSKSGVAATPGAIIGTGVPQIPQGPWLTQPGVFAKAAMPTLNQPVGWTGSPTSPLTPTAQANAAQMPQQPVTPAANAATAAPTQLAQAPPAPGVNISAHTSALANAGMAIYAHYGGDPSTASHEDITNFHNQLLSHLGGSAPGATTPPATAAGRAPSAPAAPAPVKMQTGGVVPDYWHPNPRPQQPARMQQPQQPQQVPQSDSPWSADGQDTQGQGTSQGTSQGPSWIQNAIQAKQAKAYASAPNIGSLAGEQAYVTGEPVAGVGAAGVSGPGTGVPTLQAAGAVSGLASGLSAAAQAYADSIKPWQMQKSAIPDPSSFQRNQPINLGSVPT